jgi:hypothetical protein
MSDKEITMEQLKEVIKASNTYMANIDWEKDWYALTKKDVSDIAQAVLSKYKMVGR